MLEVAGGSAYREIDRFKVELSASSFDHIASYTGVNNISVIDLSYQLLCLNPEECPDSNIFPQGQSIFCIITEYEREL